MTTATKIAIGVAIAAVLGAAGYYGFRNQTPGTQETATETQSGSESSGKKMAFSQLATQGGTYKCTVTQITKDVMSKGTVYLDRGLVSGEFSVAYGNGTSMQTAFIMRDGYTYTWTSAAPTAGIKIQNPPATEGQGGNTPNGFILDEIGEYDCEEWKADASKFVVPKTITFTAIN